MPLKLNGYCSQNAYCLELIYRVSNNSLKRIRVISYHHIILCPQMGQLYNNWLNKWHRSCIWLHFSRLYDVSFGAFTMSHFVASKFKFFYKNHKRISLRKNAHLLLSKSHAAGAWSASEISKSLKTDLLSWWYDVSTKITENMNDFR